MTNQKPTNNEGFDLPKTIKRAPKSKKRNRSGQQTKLKLLTTCSGVLFALGTYWLIDPQTAAHWIEVVTIGVAGGIANFAINSIAIARGAYQAASGVTGAAIASLGAIVTTGLTISIVSFTGLTINSIDQMVMQEFGRTQSEFVDNYVSGVRQADEVAIAVETAFDQVSAAAACEQISSCVSRKGNGGAGLTFHTLNGVATQIGTVHQSLLDGATVRDDALEVLEEVNAEIQTALNENNGSRKARRASVHALLSQQRVALADLERALPLSVVAGLAETLETGVTMPNDHTLTQRINARLFPAGKGISQALGSIEASAIERPNMPPETGVMETLKWVGFFLPLFSMLVLIDTLFPALLWFFTYSAIRPSVEPEDGDGDDDDPFSPSTVLETPPVQIAPAKRKPTHSPRTKRRATK